MPIKDRAKRLAYHRNYNGTHYANNHDKRKNQVRKRRQKIKKWWREYKATLVCVDCGFKGSDNIWAMEFDHLVPSEKSRTVSRMVGEGVSIATIQAEIAKCEPVCSNCHRKREHTRWTDGKPNNKDRSMKPSAISGHLRRRNAEKRLKRQKVVDEYAKLGRLPPGPKPKPLRSHKPSDIAARQAEEE
jgi:hypothetical protein